MDRFYWNMVRYQDKIEEYKYCTSYKVAHGEIDLISEAWLEWQCGLQFTYGYQGKKYFPEGWFDCTLANGKRLTDF